MAPQPQGSNTQGSSAKMENALIKIQNRDSELNSKDPRVYYDDAGRAFRTDRRVMSDVTAPTRRILTDAEVFSYPNGAPNYHLLRDHFIREGRLTEDQVVNIITQAGEIFRFEPNMLQIKAPVTICGDIHGQYYDLVKLFEVAGDPDQTSFLFLGDYVDRGDYSLECLLLMYSMKINHPKTFIMLRGNHESRQMTAYFTFEKECMDKYSKKVYAASLASFAALPIAALVNKQMFCVHAGISKDLRTLADIDKIDRFAIDFPHRGLYCDLMWSDPLENYDGDNSPAEYSINRDRGCSYMYNYHAVCEFLKRNNLLCVIRAHQAQNSGYRMYKPTQQRFPSLITLFSAPNYCGNYGNKAAILVYDSVNMNVKQFKNQPQPYHLPLGHDVFSWTIPFAVERTLDLLTRLLNVCTDDELKGVTVDRHFIDSADYSSDIYDSYGYSDSEPATPEEATLEKDKIRNKLLAIGRVARMMKMLRQESDKVERLRKLSGGASLPRGVLLDGASELDRKITSFEEARLADMKYEAAPQTTDDSDDFDDDLYEAIKRKWSIR